MAMRQIEDLRPYQQRIASHLYEHDEALCVLRPGGGKTVAALTAIGDLLLHGVIRHALVIAPKRVARVVWPDEIDSWAHTRRLVYEVMDGSPMQRLRAIATAGTRCMTIVGVDVAQWLVEQIRDMDQSHPMLDLLVVDEISRLRDPTGARAKALASVASRFKMLWGMSGTLRPNSALDLFMPARIVTRGKLWGKSYYQWRKQHFYSVDYMGYDWKALPGEEEKLNEALAPLTVMVPEDEIPKVTPVVVLDRVELPEPARQEYRRMQQVLCALAGDGDNEVVAGSMAIATGKLAQMANGFLYDEGSTHAIHDAKREWLADLIKNATEPMLLIYEYRDDLRTLRVLLGEDLPYLGAGVSDKQAAANIADWNAGKLKFMALHPASGGHGLNLQHGGADMAWISPTWSPEMWEQTIARLARPGQTRPVVVRVCVATDTVDELKLDRVHHKMSAQEAFESWLRKWHAHAAAATDVAGFPAAEERAVEASHL
jgi:SNF2-related domain